MNSSCMCVWVCVGGGGGVMQPPLMASIMKQSTIYFCLTRFLLLFAVCFCFSSSFFTLSSSPSTSTFRSPSTYISLSLSALLAPWLCGKLDATWIAISFALFLILFATPRRAPFSQPVALSYAGSGCLINSLCHFSFSFSVSFCAIAMITMLITGNRSGRDCAGVKLELELGHGSEINSKFEIYHTHYMLHPSPP